jgi:hypothetical protein
MIFRFRFEQHGGHTHVRLFAGTIATSLGKCGDLTFRNEEWAEFVARLKRTGGGIEFLPEHKPAKDTTT